MTNVFLRCCQKKYCIFLSGRHLFRALLELYCQTRTLINPFCQLTFHQDDNNKCFLSNLKTKIIYQTIQGPAPKLQPELQFFCKRFQCLQPCQELLPPEPDQPITYSTNLLRHKRDNAFQLPQYRIQLSMMAAGQWYFFLSRIFVFFAFCHVLCMYI